MIPYEELSKEELLEIKSDLDAQFEAIKAKGLNLDMSRGKRNKTGNISWQIEKTQIE